MKRRKRRDSPEAAVALVDVSPLGLNCEYWQMILDAMVVVKTLDQVEFERQVSLLDAAVLSGSYEGAHQLYVTILLRWLIVWRLDHFPTVGELSGIADSIQAEFSQVMSPDLIGSRETLLVAPEFAVMGGTPARWIVGRLLFSSVVASLGLLLSNPVQEN